jgi:hypothetical protein
VASGGFLKWRRRGRGGAVDAAWRAETGRREGASGAAWDSAAARQRQAAARPRRGVATSRDRPNKGVEKGLIGGPQPQCRVAAPDDRQTRAAQCQAAQIQIEFKNSSNRFKFAQILTDPKGAFPYSKKWK